MQFANIQWNNQQPYALDFDDVYYSSDNGLAETNYVFIKHNQLTERFSSEQLQTFTIIETGFGTGLNFFSTAQHFLTHAPPKASCHFISIERYPLKQADFIKANQHWPILRDIAKQLYSAYDQLQEGQNLFQLCQNRISLTLWIDDVSECLQRIQTPTDAWFLDGFAPAKNSEMWSAHLFNHVARLSKPGATFSTFTSAGFVRRQLEAIGFNVYKTAGFGKKREMLYGLYP